MISAASVARVSLGELYCPGKSCSGWKRFFFIGFKLHDVELRWSWWIIPDRKREMGVNFVLLLNPYRCKPLLCIRFYIWASLRNIHTLGVRTLRFFWFLKHDYLYPSSVKIITSAGTQLLCKGSCDTSTRPASSSQK